MRGKHDIVLPTLYRWVSDGQSNASISEELTIGYILFKERY